VAYATNADIPPDVKSRFSDRCQTVWRDAWNSEFDRDGSEERAFKVAETAAMNCEMATAGKSSLALKSTGPDTVEGLAIPFDSYDTDRETFTKSTDLCLEWFGKSGRPLLYDHGLDEPGALVVGRQEDFEERADGLWAQSQLKRNTRYRKAIDRLIDEGALGYSTGAMQHLAKKNAKGEITRWPWVELSMTPIPAHPATLLHYVKSSDAIAHLEAVDMDVPPAVKAALVALDEWASSDSDDSLPDGLKFADLVDRLSDDGPAWVKARLDWYAKSGRVLSAATRERLATHPQALRQLADDLDELLTTADGGKSAKVDALALLLARRATEAIDEKLGRLRNPITEGTIQ
jgi:cation transport regulator ChaB